MPTERSAAFPLLTVKRLVGAWMSPPPPAKNKLSAEERRARQADRLTTIRLRMLIGRELEDRGITTPAEIGAAIGMPAAEATKLLRGHQWREGDVALLQAAAARLGMQVSDHAHPGG